MTFIDRLLQRRRIMIARGYIPIGSRVLDVGCADGALFRRLSKRIESEIGIDPDLVEIRRFGNFTLIPGNFPSSVVGEVFDAITMLAVIEHIPEDDLSRWPAECHTLLRHGGHLVITVPSAAVDRLLFPLQRLRLIDGMALDTHHGFSPERVPELFSGDGLALVARRSFELGLNNLFVFEKT